MKKLKIKLFRMFHVESQARCKARVKREIKELYRTGVLYNIVLDGEFGYYRNY